MLWTDAPTRCPNGHRLGPSRVLVGWLASRAGTLEQGSLTHDCFEGGAVTLWEPTCSWKLWAPRERRTHLIWIPSHPTKDAP